MNGNPSLAVVVPSFNGGNDTLRCLAALKKSVGAKLAVIVVDNASTDDSVLNVRKQYPSVAIVEEQTNTGFVGACTRGFTEAQKCGASYVAFINQDCFVADNCLSELVAALQNEKEAAAAQALILLDQDREQVNSAGNCIHYLGFGFSDREGEKITSGALVPYLKAPRQVTYASGAALMVRTADVKTLGLFPEAFFMYHEDLDFGWRILLAGKKSVLVPSARAFHRYEFSRSANIKYYYGERNRLIVLLQNYHWLTLLLMFPAWFAMEVGIVGFALFKGWLPLKVKGYLYIVVHFSELMKERARRQKTRTVKDSEVLRHMSGSVRYQAVAATPLYFVNPFLEFYYLLIRAIIFW